MIRISRIWFWVIVASLIASGLAVASTASGARSLTAQTNGFSSMYPSRVVDTRISLGATKLGPNGTVTFSLSSIVPANARAVAVSLTAVQPTEDTYLTMWPTGESQPLASNLNLRAGELRANAVIVGLGAEKSVSVFNSRGSLDIVVDITGYFVSGFEGITPTRVMDTRSGIGGSIFGPGSERTVRVAGVAGVPADASAVAVNVTATEPSKGTFLTVFPAGAARPLASTLNVAVGQTAANFAVVGVGSGGGITLYSDQGNVHGIIDVFGWFDANGTMNPMTPQRVLDTRDGTCGTRLAQGETRRVNLGRKDSNAVFVNVTAVDATEGTYITVFPTGNSKPSTSNLNPMNNHPIPNFVLVGTGTAGEISIYNHRGSVEVIVDVFGFFDGPERTGSPSDCSDQRPPTTDPTNPSLDAAVVAQGTGMTLREAEMAIDIFDRVNRERAARGIPTLTWDMALAASSYRWSKEMVISGYRHDDLNRVRQDLNSNFQAIGENIHRPMNGNEANCFGIAAAPQAACGHLDWMRSDGHRHNLLNPYYTTGGFGIYCLSRERMQWYGTQRFAWRIGEMTNAEIERRRALEPRALPLDPITAAEPTGLRCW